MPEAHRKLAVIMFTDIVGYTALMGENESKAIEYIAKNREIQQPRIQKHRGKWLKEMGDGTLSSFGTVSDAVACAIDIQRSCAEEADFKIRIGIHMGEVVEEEGDVFGDGVNIASRIESLAPAGGILISEPVFQNIHNKPDLETEFVQEASLKNVKNPIRVYEVLVDGKSARVKDQKGSRKRANRPIFLILTFLLVALGFTWFWLSSPFSPPGGSSFAADDSTRKALQIAPFNYKGSDSEIKEILVGMRSVMYDHIGALQHWYLINEFNKTLDSQADILSVQISGNTQSLRLTYRLVDNTGNQLYEDEAEGSLQEIERLLQQASLGLAEEFEISAKSVKRRSSESDATSTAYIDFLHARSLLNRYRSKPNESVFRQAQSKYFSSLTNNDELAQAYADLGQLIVFHGIQKSALPKSSIDSVALLAESALDLDRSLARAHYLQAWLHYYQDQNYTRAERQLNQCLSINPSFWQAYTLRGDVFRKQQNWKESLLSYKVVERLAGRSPNFGRLSKGMGMLYLEVGDFDLAKKYLEQSSRLGDEVAVQEALKHVYDASALFGDRLRMTQQIYRATPDIWHQKDVAVSLTLSKRYIDAEKQWENVVDALKKTKGGQLPEGHRYAHCLWMLGKKNKARKAFREHLDYCDELRRNKEASANAWYDIASIHSFLGDEDEVVSALNKLADTSPKAHMVAFMRHDPLFDNLRENEAYTTFISEQLERFDAIRQSMNAIQ